MLAIFFYGIFAFLDALMFPEWMSDTPIDILINNNYFFISGNIIGMFISYFMEQSARRDFYLRKLLVIEQEKVQAANDALEKRVQERTRQLTVANRDLKMEIDMNKHHEQEKAKLETQLLQLQKMETIGTLAGGVAHATQMHQIIMNLCTNSYHSMTSKGGILEVRLDSVNIDEKASRTRAKLKKVRYVRLHVSDTGHGMDPLTLDRIFEPFFTKKEVGFGSGLGLSVVHGIVSNYNGTIEVESEPGTGSTFVIYLPQHAAHGVEDKDTSPKARKGSERILFVDDEKEITYMGEKMLESLGYTVDIRSDGPSALNELREDPQRYDLLVTDQAMPRMLGTELAGHAKKIKPDLKALIITGYNDSIPENAKDQYGITEIILKPLMLSEFSKLIRKVLDDKQPQKI